jgi:hypothetical protein
MLGEGLSEAITVATRSIIVERAMPVEYTRTVISAHIGRSIVVRQRCHFSLLSALASHQPERSTEIVCSHVHHMVSQTYQHFRYQKVLLERLLRQLDTFCHAENVGRLNMVYKLVNSIADGGQNIPLVFPSKYLSTSKRSWVVNGRVPPSRSATVKPKENS